MTQSDETIHALLTLRLDTFEKSMGGKLDALIAGQIAQNGRVRKLELWRSWMTGGMAATIFIVGFIGFSFFTNLPK